MNTKFSLKSIQDKMGRVSILGTPIDTLGGDRIKINDNTYDSTPEIYKASSSTS